MAKQTKSVLGRGIEALIKMDDLNTSGSSSISEVEISKIEVNPDQPREVFDQESLEELAASIKALGIIQPITVREIPTTDNYQLISGERRLRASVLAGLTTIPAYIKKASDENMMEMALIENIQREDLNSIEIALAFQTLIEKHNLTQEKLSERIGKKRTTITNFLRILKLPAEIQIGLRDKKIDLGHAKALLSLENLSAQLEVYEYILENHFSVRKTEEFVKAYNDPDSVELQEKIIAKPKRKINNDFDELKNHLTSFFGTKVSVSCNDKGIGKISIAFRNEQELQRVLEVFDSVKNN